MTPTTSFDEFYAHLRDEARAEGPRAVLDLRAKEVKYALVNASLAGRQTLKPNMAQAARPRRVGRR